MTNLSEAVHERQEWIAALTQNGSSAQTTPERPTGWLGALADLGGFVEGAPFANAQPAVAPAPVGENVDATTAPIAEETADDPDQARVVEEASGAPDPLADPFAEARAQGFAEGQAAALAEGAKKDGERRKLQLALRALDQAGMDALAIDLAASVRDLCSQVISEYSPDPVRLLERAREAAKMLGGAVSDCALRLNPEDIALIEPEALDQWRIVADASIERGGLLFEGPDGCVSDRPEDWRRALAASIGA